MYKIVDFLFKWDRLRNAIFNEVDWQNSITRTLQDPESMKISSAIWCEEDGWRGWHLNDNGSYYFHDIPEKDFGDIFDIILEA
jgi:predicted double-glycine peptidase